MARSLKYLLRFRVFGFQGAVRAKILFSKVAHRRSESAGSFLEKFSSQHTQDTEALFEYPETNVFDFPVTDIYPLCLYAKN